MKRPLLLLLLLCMGAALISNAQSTPNRWNDVFLSTARRDGTTAELQEWLSRGASINAQDQYGVTALMWYAYNRNFIVVEWLIKHGANLRLKGTIQDPNNPDMYYGHALAAAVGQNDYGTVRTLLQYGFPIDEPGRAPNGGNGYNALHTACYRGDLSMVGGLLYGFVRLEEAGRANPNTPCEAAGGKTPLQIAIEQEHEDIVQLLIKAGAKTGASASTVQPGNKLISLIQNLATPDAIDRLLAAGADPNEQDANGATPVMWAAYLNNTEVLEKLLRRGANPHKRGIIKNPVPKARFPYFGNALVAAIANDSFDAASVLLRQGGMRLYEPGISPDGKVNSWSGLHVGAYKGDIYVIDLVQSSVRSGATTALMASPFVNEVCGADQNMTAVLYAADGDQYDRVAALVEAGGDLRASNTHGWTLLHFAARNGSAKMAQMALDAGLSPTQKAKDGRSPLTIATDHQHPALVTLLQTYKPDLAKYVRSAPSKVTVDSLLKVTAEAEISQVAEIYRQPDLLSDELERRGSVYERSGQSALANRFFVEAALVREQQVLNRDLPYPTFCRELKDMGPEGEEQMGRVIKLVEKFKKLGNCLGAAAGKGAADNLTVLGLHRQAAEYYQSAARCQEKTEDWEQLFQSQRTLALNLRACGRFNEAEVALRKAREVAHTHLRTKRRTQAAYAIALDDQGALLLITQHYPKRHAAELAQRTLEQADSCWQALTGDVAERHANTLTLLTQAYLLTRPERALTTAQRAINLAPTGSISRANALRMSALAFAQLGQDRSAITAWTQALGHYRQSVKQTHPYYVRVLDDLSKYYRRKGLTAEAFSFQIEAMGLASFLGNAVQLQPRSDDPIGELIYFWETNFNHELGNSRMRDLFDLFDIDNQPSGPDDLDLVRVSDQANQAILTRDQGDYGTAERLFTSAIERYRQADATSPGFFVPLLNLTADLSQRQGNSNKAYELLTEAYELADTQLGNQHSAYLSTLHQLARVTALRQDRPQADKLYRNGLLQLNQRLVSQTNALSEDEFILTKREVDRYLNDHIAFYAQVAERDTAAANRLYDIILLQKGLALRNYSRFLQRAGQLRPLEVKTLVSLRQQRNSRQLAFLAHEWRNYSALDSLNQAVVQAERSLLNALPVGSSLAEKPVRWFQVRQMLKAGTATESGEAAVELVRFVRPDSSVHYGALVLTRPDRSPHYVLLCTNAQWSALIQPYARLQDTQQLADALYQNRDIYKLIWQPLERWLTAARTVYLSPVNGFANGLAFGAISLPDGTVLGARKNIRTVVSTGQIDRRTTFNLAGKPVRALLLGGVDYTCDGSEYMNLQALPGTRADIRQAEDVIRLKPGSRVQTLIDKQATEANLLHELSQPLDILHIATHGLFLKEVARSSDTLNAFAAQPDPEYQVGLILTGAGCLWRDGRGLGENDGVLTAREIRSGIALNTELVVLSACESALGREEGSEGILGLFRAFKSAGANYIMATLWEVDDMATSRFISLFYKSLAKPTSTIESAFDAAQATMRSEKRPVSQWASFVLLR